MMKPLLTILALGFFVTTVAAQETCSAIVQTAIETAAENCAALGVAEACYGNVIIDAEAQPDADNFVFESAGDLVELAAIASMRLNSRVEETGDWGISMMQVAAITADGPENVELVLFGNVEIGDPTLANLDDEVEAPLPTATPITIELSTSGNINVRSGPSTNHSILASLPAGQVVIANARNDAGDWARIQLEGGQAGWIFVPLVTTSGDVMSLMVVSAEAESPVASGGLDTFQPPPEFAPMQAFTLKSLNGLADRPCESAPDSGLLIQTPQGKGRISLRINEVLIDLGSTAFVQAAPSDDMVIHVLDGLAIVSVEGIGVIDPLSGALGPVVETAIATEGMRVRVPMDGTLQPAGAPTVEPYEQDGLFALPLGLTREAVEIVAPATPFDGTIQAGTWQRQGLYETSPCGEIGTVGAISEITITARDLDGFAEEQRTTNYAQNYEEDLRYTKTTILQDEISPPDTWTYHFNYWIQPGIENLRPNYGTDYRWDFRNEYRFLTSTRMIQTVTGIFNYCPGTAFVIEWVHKE